MLKFSGDYREMSVENFLYRALTWAEREEVLEDILLRDIHILLEGAASGCFFFYVDDLVTDQGMRPKL